jgi:molybdate transport system regulatory protein
LNDRRDLRALPNRLVGVMPKLTLRIDFDGDRAIGPGKVKLLEVIEALGSISAAGRRMGMSYRRAWLLVDSLNRCFREPLVSSHAGGTHGGGARLTANGVAVIRHYRAVEAAAYAAGAAHLEALTKALADLPPAEAPGREDQSTKLPPT